MDNKLYKIAASLVEEVTQIEDPDQLEKIAEEIILMLKSLHPDDPQYESAKRVLSNLLENTLAPKLESAGRKLPIIQEQKDEEEYEQEIYASEKFIKVKSITELLKKAIEWQPTTK